MKWSFVLLLPGVTSFFWAVVTLITKRNPSRAQILLSLMLIMIGFAATMLMVFFRGRAGSLFIYDYIFELVSIFSAPLYFLSVCSLSEPRGATRKQRRVLLLPILFIVGLTIFSDLLGPRRYEEMCHAIRLGEASFIKGDHVYNLMYFWNHYFFNILMLSMSFVLLLISNHKLRLFVSRFNSYYAQRLKAKPLNGTWAGVASWCFLPLALFTVILVDNQPFWMKYWLVATSLILTVVQWFMGRFVYSLDYDSRYLSNLIKIKKEE